MRTILSIVSLLAAITAFAQKPKGSVQAAAAPKTDTASIIDYYESMYTHAVTYSDLQVATNAMYAILTYRPNDVGIKDTIARLYFNRSMPFQAMLVGKEVLDKEPENTRILEVVAFSQQDLGLLKEALESFEKLYRLTTGNYYLYQVASLQYSLQRFGECQTSLSTLLQKEGIDQDKITMNYGQAGSQQVSMKAAIMNMFGMISVELGKNDTAKQFFEEAAKIDEKFVLPRANLEQLAKAAAAGDSNSEGGNSGQ